MIVLSLDLSLNCSGYAVFDTSKRVQEQRVLDYGIIYNKHLSTSQLGLKLFHIELKLKALLYAFNPDVIVVEELTGSAFQDTTRLAMVHGILYKLTQKFKNIHFINNKKFKKEFTGNGSAKKDQVADRVSEYLPSIHFRTDDISDALGIGIYFTEKEGMCKWKNLL